MTTTSPFSLLVVDDEPDLRTLYELTLLREGYDIDTAGSVEEALARLEARRYSLVITDMRLPDGSGLDLLRRLEETDRSEKAIVITAYGSAENAVEALKARAYDYLTKPVSTSSSFAPPSHRRSAAGCPLLRRPRCPQRARRPRSARRRRRALLDRLSRRRPLRHRARRWRAWRAIRRRCARCGR